MTLSPALAEASPAIFALLAAVVGWVVAHRVAYRPKADRTPKP
jgi:hypothetical protein